MVVWISEDALIHFAWFLFIDNTLNMALLYCILSYTETPSPSFCLLSFHFTFNSRERKTYENSYPRVYIEWRNRLGVWHDVRCFYQDHSLGEVLKRWRAWIIKFHEDVLIVLRKCAVYDEQDSHQSVLCQKMELMLLLGQLMKAD